MTRGGVTGGEHWGGLYMESKHMTNLKGSLGSREREHIAFHKKK
jgi:hypothetical protein